MDERRMAGRAVRGAPAPAAGGGLPDARLARARPTTPCRRPGCASAAPTPASVENLGGWLTTVVARVCLNMLRVARARGARSRSTCSVPDPIVGPEDRRRPRAGGAAGRLGRAGAAGGARHADAGRAARLRAARHVRRAVRGDRRRWSSGRRPRPASWPAAPAAGSGGRPRRPTPTWPASARSSTPSSPPPATATSRRWSPCSTPTSCSGPTAARRGPARAWCIHGAQAVAAQAAIVARLAPFVRPALVNGAAGAWSSRAGGRCRSWASPSPTGGSSPSTCCSTPTAWPGSTWPSSTTHPDPGGHAIGPYRARARSARSSGRATSRAVASAPTSPEGRWRRDQVRTRRPRVSVRPATSGSGAS